MSMTNRETLIATGIASGAAAEAAASLAKDLQTKLRGKKPELVLVFASTAQPLESIVSPLSQAFPGSVMLGATTAGEFTEKGDSKKSVSAIAIAGDFKIFGGIGTGLQRDPEAAVHGALEGIPRAVHDYPHQIAIVLLDPLSGNSEEATLIISSLLGNEVRLAGGAAGDDLAMKATQVSCGR